MQIQISTHKLELIPDQMREYFEHKLWEAYEYLRQVETNFHPVAYIPHDYAILDQMNPVFYQVASFFEHGKDVSIYPDLWVNREEFDDWTLMVSEKYGTDFNDDVFRTIGKLQLSFQTENRYKNLPWNEVW